MPRFQLRHLVLIHAIKYQTTRARFGCRRPAVCASEEMVTEELHERASPSASPQPASTISNGVGSIRFPHFPLENGVEARIRLLRALFRRLLFWLLKYLPSLLPSTLCIEFTVKTCLNRCVICSNLSFSLASFASGVQAAVRAVSVLARFNCKQLRGEQYNRKSRLTPPAQWNSSSACKIMILGRIPCTQHARVDAARTAPLRS